MSSADSHLVAIHQPNFLPWLGYWNKIARAQSFIILDDAQFQKTGGTWCNRVRLLVGGSPAWLTMPVNRSYHGMVEIRHVRIRNDIPWRDKLLATIRSNYGRCPFFKQVFPGLIPVLTNPTESLVTYNLDAIRYFCGLLGLDDSKIVLASSLGVVTSATQRLVQLVQRVGGNAYLAGGGADGYQEDGLFQLAGVTLFYQQFIHPEYRQPTAARFVPGLSVVDALMNCGVAETAQLVAAADE